MENEDLIADPKENKLKAEIKAQIERFQKSQFLKFTIKGDNMVC